MNFSDTILASLIPRAKAEKPLTNEAFRELAKARVPAEYFSGNYRVLFDYVVKQNSKDSILDREILEAYLTREAFNEEKNNEIRILFNILKEQTVSTEKLKEIIPAFIEQMGSINFGTALQTSAKILTEGTLQGKQTLKGLSDARKYLISKISGLQGVESEAFPQGKVSESMEMLWDIYDEAEKNPEIGVRCGIKEIDILGGARKGELWVVGGYMGEGKSQFLRGYAYYASTFQKKNVVYATLEMPFRDLLVQFASLHSTHPKFNTPFGIKANHIFNGKLSADEKIKLKEITKDYEQEDYGINYILQLPFNTTVASLREKLIYLNSIFPIDILMLDYTALLKPEFSRMSSIDATTEIANDLKLTALSFNNGEGLPIIAAHQVSRDARNRAEEAEPQRYDRAFLATSSGIERAADVILWLLRTDSMLAQREVKMGVNKFRRGKVPPDFQVREYYDCSKLSSIQMEKEIVGDTTLID